jgi:hypothetical protein
MKPGPRSWPMGSRPYFQIFPFASVDNLPHIDKQIIYFLGVARQWFAVIGKR